MACLATLALHQKRDREDKIRGYFGDVNAPEIPFGLPGFIEGLPALIPALWRADRLLPGLMRLFTRASVGWCACVGVQQQAELVQGMKIIFTPATYIAAPGGKIWHSDQLVAQPGEIGDIYAPELASLAFIAWDSVIEAGVCGHGLEAALTMRG